MPDKPLRMLVIGAHPDDCEYLAGGITVLYSHLGHQVKLVSLTNGDAGHTSLAGAQLARRRKAEAEAAAKTLGAQSLVLDHHDGALTPTLELRNEVIAIIREYAPDIVMSHRPNDYHPDHRYTGVVVQDAINMVIVGNLVPFVPPLPYIPVMLHMWDHFLKPYPFIGDVLVDIDDVYEQKLDGLHCHASQVYEFVYGPADVPPEQRRAWLREKAEADMVAAAQRFREQLIQVYGQARAEKIHYIEAFEVCEYGSPLTPEKRERFFPFVP